MDVMYSLVDFLLDTLRDVVQLISSNWLLELCIFLSLVSRVLTVFKRRFL